MQITLSLLKKFTDWTKLKVRIHVSEEIPYFRDGQIWWISLGQNIGAESNGKHEKFERPVLVLKKFSKDSFWAISITSQNKSGQYYLPITVNSNKYFLNLSQLRLVSSKRLSRHVGTLSEDQFLNARNEIAKLI